MIKQLHIKNFAIIEEIEIPLHKGLTVITGETGSGKSLLMEALHIATGGKANKTHLMKSDSRAIIDVVVDDKDIRRVITAGGRTKSFINDEPVLESDFINKTQYTIDFHGQHDQQYILNPQSHIQYLDRFSESEKLTHRIADVFHQIKQKKAQLEKLQTTKKEIDGQAELRQFQLHEIASAKVRLGEDIALENEVKILRNLDELSRTADNMNHSLVESDQSILIQLVSTKKSLEKLIRIDKEFEQYLLEIDSAIVTIQESAAGMTNYVDSLNHNPERLKEIEDRLEILDRLKRKYGGSLEAVSEVENELAKSSYQSEHLEKEIQTTETTIHELIAEYKHLADTLHDKRMATIPILTKKMVQAMNQLNMPESKFDIHLNQRKDTTSFVSLDGKPIAAYDNGYEIAEFYLSANPGIKPKPLAKIASGGEISRIMLAMKTVFNQSDPIECLVFDEIDTGISGGTAIKVAECLKSIAKNRQVICITHLPQITHAAHNHLHVTKLLNEKGPQVMTKYITGAERETVISSLTGMK